MSIRVETRDITPEMAKHWLSKNKRNRAINQRRVKLYADEMSRGNWLDHHQGIAFYADGSLADGQHRLAAVVQAGISVKMIVAWDVPDESGLMIDGHQQRQVHQAIKISGLADWIGKNEVSIARMMLQIQHNSTSSIPMSHTDLIKYCEFHRDSISFAMSRLSNHKRYVTTATLKAAVACAFYFEDAERLSEFCCVIESGMPESKDDRAAVLIREWLIECGSLNMGTGGRMDACKRAMRAIKAFCERQPISKLYQPADFIYTPPLNTA